MEALWWWGAGSAASFVGVGKFEFKNGFSFHIFWTIKFFKKKITKKKICKKKKNCKKKIGENVILMPREVSKRRKSGPYENRDRIKKGDTMKSWAQTKFEAKPVEIAPFRTERTEPKNGPYPKHPIFCTGNMEIWTMPAWRYFPCI